MVAFDWFEGTVKRILAQSTLVVKMHPVANATGSKRKAILITSFVSIANIPLTLFCITIHKCACSWYMVKHFPNIFIAELVQNKQTKPRENLKQIFHSPFLDPSNVDCVYIIVCVEPSNKLQVQTHCE